MTELTIDAKAIPLEPDITLSTEDYVKLSALVRAAMSRMPALADSLSEELERAQVVDNEHFPAQAVCMELFLCGCPCLSSNHKRF